MVERSIKSTVVVDVAKARKLGVVMEEPHRGGKNTYKQTYIGTLWTLTNH